MGTKNKIYLRINLIIAGYFWIKHNKAWLYGIHTYNSKKNIDTRLI